MYTIKLNKGKKAYFASDFHLGAPDREKSLVRERKVVAWLESIRHDAQVVFLCGDLFDFWFEYKRVIPKGFVRFLGKLAEFRDEGIEIIIFTGNHDMWMLDYLHEEIGASVFRSPQVYFINEQKFLVGHGDGLGPGDYFYKLLKVVFESSLCRFLFGRVLHANLGQLLGTSWANHSWKKHEKDGDVYHFDSKDKEILYRYCEEIEAQDHHDYYIFGHRHLKMDLKVGKLARYVNLGDWIYFYSYAEFDGMSLALKDWDEPRSTIR